METLVIAATITGTAAIAAAIIHAYGNISAAKLKAMADPAQKEIKQAAPTSVNSLFGWKFWMIIFFIIVFWIYSIVAVDFSTNRYLFALVVASPAVVCYLMTMKLLVKITGIIMKKTNKA